MIAGVHGSAGDDQVAHAGQTGKCGLLSAQRYAQPGDLRQTPGHEHGPGIIAKAHTVTDPRTEGDDVLQRRTDLRAHHIGGGVDPEAVIHKEILHQLRSLLILGGSNDGAGQSPADFLGVGGAAEHHHGAARVQLLPHSLAQPFGGAVLNSLGHADHHSAGLYDMTELPGGGAHGKGGRRQHNSVAVSGGIHIVGEPERFRQRYALEHRVLPVRGNGGILLLAEGPQADVMAVFQQDQCQCGAPAAAAQYTDSHLDPSESLFLWCR